MHAGRVKLVGKEEVTFFSLAQLVRSTVVDKRVVVFEQDAEKGGHQILLSQLKKWEVRNQVLTFRQLAINSKFQPIVEP